MADFDPGQTVMINLISRHNADRPGKRGERRAQGGARQEIGTEGMPLETSCRAWVACRVCFRPKEGVMGW